MISMGAAIVPMIVRNIRRRMEREVESEGLAVESVEPQYPQITSDPDLSAIEDKQRSLASLLLERKG